MSSVKENNNTPNILQPSPSASKENLVWVDLEFTGFNYAQSTILEIGVIVTDTDLNIVEEGPNLVIHHSEEEIAKIDRNDAFLNNFFINGFIDEVRNSPYSMEQAENMVLEFVKKHVAPMVSPLCGNSVYNDRLLLIKDMPKFDSYLHYRDIDVSTVKELASYWMPDLPKYQKKDTHRAMEDIKESIAELRYLKENFIKL